MSLWEQLNKMTPEQFEQFESRVGEVMEHELEREYRDMLNDCHEPAKICGYEYEPAQALKEVDPVAYRCGFSDFTGDDNYVIEFKGKYYRSDAIQEYIDGIDQSDEEGK
jgi:hypothetical protein